MKGIKCGVNLMVGKGQGNKVGKYFLDTGQKFAPGIGNMVRKFKKKMELEDEFYERGKIGMLN